MRNLSSLSVVIPSRDTRELTLACLGSLLPGSPSGVQVVVVDDASTDGTSEAIRHAFPEVQLVRHNRARGFSASANRGLEKAKGDIRLLLNSDTELIPGALDSLLAAFAVNPCLGVAGGNLRYPDGADQWSGGREPGPVWLFAMASGLPALFHRTALSSRWRRSLGTEVKLDTGLRTVDWVTGAALAMRREVWELAGPMDDRFVFYAQDLDFCRRAAEAGWEVAVVCDFLVVHHHGSTLERTRGEKTWRHQDPTLLWTDLVRWAGKRRGDRGARRAARALRLGGLLRWAARRGVEPFLGRRRVHWRRGSAILASAIRELTQFDPTSR